MSRILVFNEELPPKLEKKLRSDAKARNATMNDRANTIIASYYGVQEITTGQPYQAPSASRFRLRVPEHLRDELAQDAARQRATIRGIALNILLGHYELPPVEAARRPRSSA
jgi:hypothetical protein